jgi:hypothetical protein
MTPQTRQTTPSGSAAPAGRRASFGAPHGSAPASDARPGQSGGRGPAREDADAGAKPSSAAWMLLLPLLCCGGPLVLAAAASAGALGWGALGAGIAVLIAAGLLIVRRRAVRSCSAAPGQAWRHPQSVAIPDRDRRR